MKRFFAKNMCFPLPFFENMDYSMRRMSTRSLPYVALMRTVLTEHRPVAEAKVHHKGIQGRIVCNKHVPVAVRLEIIKKNGLQKKTSGITTFK